MYGVDIEKQFTVTMEIAVAVLAMAVLLFVITSFVTRKIKIAKPYNTLYVLITGCDTGFGRELAYRLDKLSFNVIATCLTDAGAYQLSQNTSGNLYTTILDVTKLDQIVNLFELVKSILPNEKALWGVVNNAGVVGSLGPCEFLEKSNYLQCLDVNLFGMTEVNRQFLPLLRKSRGRIINMVSMAGKMATPSMTCYTVSKFAAEGYSDCLRREVRCQGISVHVIEPGIFDTKLLIKTVDFEDAISTTFQQGDKTKQEYYGLNFPNIEGSRLTNFRFHAASPRTYQVVDAYIDALTARFPKTRYVVGLDAWTCTWFMKLPEWIIDAVVSKFGTYPAGVKKD